ncbi:MAG: hypothetical protein E7668_03615 [Ruminococcaceae bacterium]|nr:hypothetical protein [Oscillospiraceae bacterium]
MKRKLICLALSVVMLLSILPLAIFAAEETTAPITEYGTTTADWYTIGTVAELNWFIEKESTSSFTCNVRLIENIDYTAEGATAPTAAPRAEYSEFTGTFDGNDKTIKGATTVILCCINGTSTVKDLTLLDSTVEVGDYGGVLATDMWGSGNTVTVENVQVKNATVTGVSSAARFGGLIGTIWDKGDFTLKVTNCTVSGTTTLGSGVNNLIGAAAFVGFFRGNAGGTCTVNFTDCVADMDFNVAAGNSVGVAGFIGNSYSNIKSGSTATFTNCVNYGDITSATNKPVAGFSTLKIINIAMTNCVNFGTMTSTDANGLVNDTTGTITLTDCYDTAEAVAVPTDKGDYAACDIAVADAQGYKAAATFADWSFGTDWMLTNGYPVPASIFEATAKAQNDKAIVYEGVQYTEANENAFNVRFVATISEETFAAAQQIGYDVVMVEAGKAPVGATFTSDTVYKSLVGYEEDEQVVYNAEEFGGDYLSAIAINNVTASGTVTLIVRPYVLTEAGTQAGIPVACVFTEGALVAQYAY